MPRKRRNRGKPTTTAAVEGDDDAADTLACTPVAWLPRVTETDSVRGQHCTACNCEVWVMRRNLSLIASGLRLLCIPCVRNHANEFGDVWIVPLEVLRRRGGGQRHQRMNRAVRYDLT